MIETCLCVKSLSRLRLTAPFNKGTFGVLACPTASAEADDAYLARGIRLFDELLNGLVQFLDGFVVVVLYGIYDAVVHVVL